MSRLSTSVLAVVAVLALSACKSEEERAAEYFASAQSLLAEGDVDRAIIELRNVFQNDAFHREARELLAEVLLERDEVQQAFGQYLLLIEQYPDAVEARLTLAEIAMDFSEWDVAERHGRAAVELAPDLPRAQAVDIGLRYREAALEREEETLVEVGEAAVALLPSQPDNVVLLRVAIDHMINRDAYDQALVYTDRALGVQPESRAFHQVKLQILATQNDEAAAGAQLERMVELFPEDDELKRTLLSWYLSEENLAGAEAFLRAEAGERTGPTEGHMDVVNFLLRTQGRDAARAELEALAEANAGTPNEAFYLAGMASLDFEEGRTEEAIAALSAILEGAEPSDQTRDIAANQARMLVLTGERARAEEIVDQILEADPGHVEAIKLRARWLIADDRQGEAIRALRAAQAQAPRDPQLMTLLAAAFERDGSPDLAGEQLSQAVEASENGEEESLRYARFLVNQGRLNVAETVLRDARRAQGDRPAVLLALARVLLAQQNWPEVQEIIAFLETAEGTGAEEIKRSAEQLRAAVLLGQNQVTEGLDILADQARSAGADIRPVVAFVITQIRAGRVQEARSYLDEAMAETPGNPTLRLLSANLDAVLGKVEQAEAELATLIEEQPQSDLPVRLLYGMLTDQGKTGEARAVLEAGLERMEDSAQLLWIKAGLVERANRFEEAIAIYERIYELNSSDLIAANNLASMLSVYRDDAESLERARTIARRLRSRDFPAFQDTYGWIEYRLGNLEEALPYLEAGAAGLPGDPVAQFHLGMVYADLGRTEAALGQFEKMLELAGDRPLPQVEIARARIAELTAPEPEPVPDAATDQ